LDEDPGSDYVIPTDYADLNPLLNGGLRPGDFVVAAGLPGVGTSMFALGLARACGVRHKRGTYIASLEANALRTAQRILSAEAKVELDRVTAGSMNELDGERVATNAPDLPAAPIHVEDEHRDLAAIQQDAFAFADTVGSLRLIFVDGAHLLVPAHDYGGRAQFADDFARDLKELAVVHGLTVVATVPLEFPFAEMRRRPLMRDFGKRQSFAAAADAVVLLHREDDDPVDPLTYEVEAIVAKNRGGKRGLVRLAFQGHYARLFNMRQD
jgi:replicative DNA helicase